LSSPVCHVFRPLFGAEERLRERKPVSPAVAVRLGKLFGDGAGVWVRMQAAYDTWHAEREEDVSKIPTLRSKAA